MRFVNTILEKSGLMEVLARRITCAVEPIKRIVKRMLRTKSINAVSENNEKISMFSETLAQCGVKDGDIIIIHSSLDGLRGLGLSAEKIIENIMEIFSDCTVVFPTFPLEPQKSKDIYYYNPLKSLCGTGMLPNLFLRKDCAIRSTFPYNSLAALGEQAELMMENDYKCVYPHDSFSAWEYCRQHHAKILFLGTTSREANTMAIHMIPDIMGAEWPISNWYSSRRYQIKINNTIIERDIKVQNKFWYRYVNEYKSDKSLRDAGILRRIGFDDITIEVIDDSKKMTDFLIDRCKKGELMYKIPQRYWK